ncbi:MAG TPA: BadF/BadG/BcrA/BcrD ATPase family protein [Acidobacteriaceae bacterium]|jgi:N-acetylglucosamine kinase-like BadF-type ATPase
MTYFLGLDAGGTSTRAALADDKRVLGRAKNGSIKVMRVSAAQAEANLRALLDEVAGSSGVAIVEVASTCVGIAGVTISTVTGWIWQTLGPMLRGDLVVCGDVEIALDAAFPGEAGVLVMAGTGSNTLGRTSAGELLTVGGWGPLLADEGSGHWIGLRALRAAIREHDEQGTSKLLTALAAQWKADTLEQVVEIAHALPPPDFAALTRTVVEMAENGDRLAQAVLQAGGRVLGEDASLALRKVLALEPTAPRRVAFTGSVLENIATVREAMFTEIEREHPGAQVVRDAVDPTEGALWRARQNLQEAP